MNYGKMSLLGLLLVGLSSAGIYLANQGFSDCTNYQGVLVPDLKCKKGEQCSPSIENGVPGLLDQNGKCLTKCQPCVYKDAQGKEKNGYVDIHLAPLAVGHVYAAACKTKQEMQECEDYNKRIEEQFKFGDAYHEENN